LSLILQLWGISGGRTNSFYRFLMMFAVEVGMEVAVVVVMDDARFNALE
jgi:hypothetical protein